MSTPAKQRPKQGLSPYLSPAAAWAFALGTSIGWGSLVITSNTYLSQAGPLGSTLGMVVGAVIMLVISRNYHYMITSYPDAGGAYTYAKEAIGYDYGFLTAWFLSLTYFAVFWANVTSLPLFAHYFLGDLFQFGFHYSVFGYEVFFGEALLSVVAILLTALLCAKQKRVASWLMIGMAGLIVLGIVICFVAAILRMNGSGHSFHPMMIPEKNGLLQVIRIACISPWAFIGFESISHGAEEFTFSRSRTFRVLTVTVVSTTVLYIFVILLSATAFPPEYSSWLAYISDLSNIAGMKGLPAFYAAHYYLGQPGVVILMLALLALIVTSLIGNTVALSRLIYALAKDEVLPKQIARLNSNQIPDRAILLIAAVSVIIPFLGRTAIGWIVDVTTLGATLVYAFVSGSVMETASRRGDKTEQWTGRIGLILMVGFILFLLLPNLFAAGSMATESYILFALWGIVGFLFFHQLLKRDHTNRFGKSIVVWVVLLSLVLYTALIWMGEATMNSTSRAMLRVQEYYTEVVGSRVNVDAFVQQELRNLQFAHIRSMVIVIVLFGISLITLLNIYNLMQKRAEESEQELSTVKLMANTDPLTGVKSKHAYVEREKEWNERIRSGEMERFAVAVCDVNGLKQVNDTLGHKAGDEYIRSASKMICNLFQHSPVFRVGGDEFVVLLTGPDFEIRQELMERLHNQSVENIRRGEVIVAGGASDYFPGSDTDVHDVFERADGLMYQNKKALKGLGAPAR